MSRTTIRLWDNEALSVKHRHELKFFTSGQLREVHPVCTLPAVSQVVSVVFHCMKRGSTQSVYFHNFCGTVSITHLVDIGLLTDTDGVTHTVHHFLIQQRPQRQVVDTVVSQSVTVILRITHFRDQLQFRQITDRPVGTGYGTHLRDLVDQLRRNNLVVPRPLLNGLQHFEIIRGQVPHMRGIQLHLVRIVSGSSSLSFVYLTNTTYYIAHRKFFFFLPSAQAIFFQSHDLILTMPT